MPTNRFHSMLCVLMPLRVWSCRGIASGLGLRLFRVYGLGFGALDLSFYPVFGCC